MTRRRLSIQSLKSRIETLSRRHREIDRRIEREQQQPWPDMNRINLLKRERLGLKDAIRLTQAMVLRNGGKAA